MGGCLVCGTELGEHKYGLCKNHSNMLGLATRVGWKKREREIDCVYCKNANTKECSYCGGTGKITWLK